jgi:hypothetical protein
MMDGGEMAGGSARLDVSDVLDVRAQAAPVGSLVFRTSLPVRPHNLSPSSADACNRHPVSALCTRIAEAHSASHKA